MNLKYIVNKSIILNPFNNFDGLDKHVIFKCSAILYRYGFTFNTQSVDILDYINENMPDIISNIKINHLYAIDIDREKEKPADSYVTKIALYKKLHREYTLNYIINLTDEQI